MGNTLKCNWQDGLGTSPTGEQCGECNPEFANRCPALNKEKQIEEMAKMLYDYLGTMILTETDSKIISSYLYNAGYRKQNEGEWLEQVRVSKEGKPLIRHYKCNLCGVYLATQANFCPNCGAKMKGSE